MLKGVKKEVKIWLGININEVYFKSKLYLSIPLYHANHNIYILKYIEHSEVDVHGFAICFPFMYTNKLILKYK